MIRIRDIPLPFDHEPDALAKAAANKLGVSLEELGPIRLVRKSIDARKKHRILAVYCVDVETADEQQVLKRCAGDPHIAATGSFKKLTRPTRGPAWRSVGPRPYNKK